MEVQSEQMKTSTMISTSCLEQKVLYYKQQCSKLLAIILNELKEVSNGEESSRHYETLTKTISEHLTSKYEIEFAYMRERDEAMIAMEKKVEDLELELKETGEMSKLYLDGMNRLVQLRKEDAKTQVEKPSMKDLQERDEAMAAMEKKVEDLELELKKTRKASKISEDGINLLIKIRKEDAQTQVEKPPMKDSSTSTGLDNNQNIINSEESPKSALARFAVEDTVRLEDELRQEKESKHKMQSSLSKRIHTLTKQLEAIRAKTPKAVIKDLRSREDTPPRAVAANAYKMLENSRKQMSEQKRNSPSMRKSENSNEFSVYRRGRRTSIAIDGDCSTPTSRKFIWKCSHPENSRRALNSKRNGYDFCNNCRTVIRNGVSIRGKN